MRIIKSCEDCLYERQINIAESIADPAMRASYISAVRNILDNRSVEDSSPYIVSLFRKLQAEYGIPSDIFPKDKYNRLILDNEERIAEIINASVDPLYTAMLYSRIGNYIDFGAMNTVDDDILMKLIDEASRNTLDENVYRSFLKDCSGAESFLLLCDNCGEIVFDKLMIMKLKERFPKLTVTVMVRGENVLNDATMEDAIQSGITAVSKVITNGTAIAGTVYSMLPSEAKEAFDNADVILSKGQGNYESLADCGRSVYYLFLCKCDLFISRFNVPKLTGMFVHHN